MDDEELLAEQRAYYRGRAPEYDDWWRREGRYEGSEGDRRAWEDEVATVEAALAAFDPRGDVLELAGGTGWWTKRLAATADRLTVVDAAPETIELNRQHVGRDDVEYVLADLFDWQPERTYDVVFFSFWLSHVPRPRFSAFWTLVRDCLSPGGRAFVLDNVADPAGPGGRDPYVVEYRPDVHLRELSDGSQHRVVKVMYQPHELERLIDSEGWTASIQATRRFVYGTAAPR